MTMTTAEPKTKIYRTVALGCRTNQYEVSAYSHQLEQMGWRAAKEGEIADLGIVNTCTVTSSADSHSRAAIREVVRQNPGSQVWVTGCLAEREAEALRQIEGVTCVVSNLDKEFLVNYLLPENEVPEFNIRIFEGHTRAFVKVQDGCNSFCSYCVIPYVRGRSRSRSLDEILREVELLISQGHREVVLTGINIGDYDGGDGKVRLAELVRSVDAMPGLKRLRLSSIDPDEVDEELQDAILNGRHTCPSLHLVLQSGSNYILKRMGRKYTRQIFLDTCQRLLAAQPDFTFTTDIIVGFPGEAEADFEQTLELVRQIRFAKVHMFPFSPRPQTKAERFSERVPAPVMAARKTQLLHLSEQMTFALRQDYVGREVEVLIEESSDEGSSNGHTIHFLKVTILGVKLPAGCLARVRLKSNEAQGLVGELIAVEAV